MSIVADFSYDLFISYAHANDQRIAEDDNGWVTDLHDVLAKKLWEEMRVKPHIWRDEGGLDGKQVHQGIEDALKSSAVVVPFPSRWMSIVPAPPSVLMNGSTTVMAHAVATAASTALPPRARISAPARAPSGCSATTISSPARKASS